MEKRGLGHIEMIMAFLIFIGFLFFGIYFFNPLNTDRLLDSSIDYAYREIISNTSADSTLYSLVINNTGPAVVAIPTSSIKKEGQSYFFVIDSSGSSLQSEIETSGFEVLAFNRGAERFVKVISTRFNPVSHSLSNAYLMGPENYTISSTESKKLASEAGFEMLKNNYDADYVNLKKQFNLPGRIDFAFSLILPDKTNITAFQQIPDGLQVLSRQERVEILSSNGTLEFADLIVKTW